MSSLLDGHGVSSDLTGLLTEINNLCRSPITGVFDVAKLLLASMGLKLNYTRKFLITGPCMSV